MRAFPDVWGGHEWDCLRGGRMLGEARKRGGGQGVSEFAFDRGNGLSPQQKVKGYFSLLVVAPLLQQNA